MHRQEKMSSTAYNKSFTTLGNSFAVNEYDASIPIQLRNCGSKNNINTSYLTSVSPVKNTLTPLSNIDHFTSRSRKRIFDCCDWKCVAITFILSCAALLIALICLLSSTQLFNSSPSSLQNLCRDAYRDEPEDTSEASLQNPRRFAASAFEEMQMDKLHSTSVPSNAHWNIRFVLPEASLMKFSFTFSAGAWLGVYASRDAIPSHTNYDFAEILGRSKKSRNSDKYNSGEFVQFLEKGTWYISIFNDGTTKSDIGFVMAKTEETNIPCPYDCHRHGVCVMGSCKCDDGYDGESCSLRTCPVLCSSRGQYVNGECQCIAGWKGKECQLRDDECEVNDCNGHGDCVDGLCHCFPGYKGENCDQVDCLDPDCSGHGYCVSGTCLCGKGWKGADCSESDSEDMRCLPDCSSHGTFDLNTQQCVCRDNWIGPDCAQERCDLDCGENGHCENNECICKDGWAGSKCNEKLCDARCLEHGQCHNGTCICIQGWNGRHCTLDGCPNNCNNHGSCSQIDHEWQCQCSFGWTGVDCMIPLEGHCSDNADNDNDGLIDCADNECCSQKECAGNPLCHTSADPLDVLLRKQPPTVTASFFQRMQFLIDEDSVQSYAHKQAFNDSRASVIRGQVVNENGQGLIGVRVSVAGDLYLGFTLSRENGWFDLMVNGGGSINLHFQRDPFKSQQKTVMVPWNEIIVIDRVMMSLEEKSIVPTRFSICIDHDYDLMKPTVLATWKHAFQSTAEPDADDPVESQVVQESLPIPGTDLHLIYHSSRVSGYLSTIQLQLTPEKIPSTLRLVHLKLSIEGILYEKTFEADPDIMFTYGWNRRNAYRQKVYGIATATVHVGYEYSSCSNVIWEIQTAQLAGHDMSISEIGGWNFEIHHRYNFQEGILQKGDGRNLYLKQQSKVISTIMGDGQQRPLNCPYCNGIAEEQRLLAPVALAAAPDGSLFIGDFNLIRRLAPDGAVKTIVELSASSVAYKYHLAVGSNDGRLYVSDPEKHQILRAINIDEPIDVRGNLEVVVGSGVKCLPGDKLACGDGRLARDARLSYPKGIAISVSGEMFIADGTNIRFVDQLGIIHTLIGDHYHKSHWKPLPCVGSIHLQKVALRWPTQLAISPVDNSLHILDDYMVLKVTPDRRLRIVAGRPSHCSPVITGNQEDASDSKTQASEVFLETPQSIAFAANGDLYISESDSISINRVRIVHAADGKISRFAGVDHKCSCLDVTCECFNDEVVAANAKLNTISAIAVTPDGHVHICDQDNLRIRTVTSPLPQQTSQEEYEIASPDTPEIYVFNRHGQHTSTKSTTTGNAIYTFRYNMNTSFGKLSSVTDATGNYIYILRDYTNEVKSIENTHGGKCRLEMSRMRMLQSFTTPDNFVVKFNYYGASGLLASRVEPDSSVVYTYDKYGRLLKSVKT